jgi:integrase
LSSEKVLQFFNIGTDGCKPQTKRVRFSHLSAFFNFLKNNLDLNFENPCELPMLREIFRPTVTIRWNIFEKETVDEIIFRTTNIRNRLILELMARGGMRIGEVLKLRFCDPQGRKLVIKDPKSGKEQEVVFIPQKVADRLREYARQNYKRPHDRIFSISYEAARIMVMKAGNMVGIYLRPHDLRRHAATYASRAGVPVEIISKVILRHSNLSPLSCTLEKSVIPKPCGGLKICMHKMIQGDPFPERSPCFPSDIKYLKAFSRLICWF